MAVDAFYRDGGTADRTDVTSLVTAIEALAERSVRVINMSLSGSANEVLQKAMAAARAKGIVIVAAGSPAPRSTKTVVSAAAWSLCPSKGIAAHTLAACS